MYQSNVAHLKTYKVTFSHTVIEVVAASPAAAIQAAAKLAGPNAQLLSCFRLGEW